MSPELIVVGSGVAGLMAATTAAANHRVRLLTDRGLGTANSAVAQGGLQLPVDSDEARHRFAEDILASGGASVDHDRLAQFVADVGATIQVLESWGLQLDREPDGSLRRVRAGGLSEDRIVTAGDQIGPAVVRVLRERVLASTEVQTKARVIGIEPEPAGAGWRLATDDGEQMTSRAVVVATGGRSHAVARAAGRPTTNPVNRNDLMYDLLLDLGLEEVDADLFQYQPYGIVDSFDSGVARCVPESLAQMGPRVVDRDGDPVAPLSANRLELCAAMERAAEEGRAERDGRGRPALRLTMSELPEATVSARFPGLARWLARHDLLGRDLLVWPAVHYQLGGFRTGPDGSTALPGLFLAGELLGGLHGVNRLMGNGITESLVTGRRAGLSADAYLRADQPPRS